MNVRYGSFADLRSARSNVRFFHTNCYHSVIPLSDFNCSAGVRQGGGATFEIPLVCWHRGNFVVIVVPVFIVQFSFLTLVYLRDVRE